MTIQVLIQKSYILRQILISSLHEKQCFLKILPLYHENISSLGLDSHHRNGSILSSMPFSKCQNKSSFFRMEPMIPWKKNSSQKSWTLRIFLRSKRLMMISSSLSFDERRRVSISRSMRISGCLQSRVWHAKLQSLDQKNEGYSKPWSITISFFLCSGI